MLTHLFATGPIVTGRIVDLALAIMALEAAILLTRYRRGASRCGPAEFLPNLLAGAFLLLTLRLALTGTNWRWMALALLGALASHLTDLRRVWRA